MNKSLWIALAAIVLIGLGAYAFTANRAAAPADLLPAGAASDVETSTLPSTMPEQAVEEDGGPAFTVVTLTDAGFSPASVNVTRGETVRFINESSRGMWVGADEHPTHTEYDGTSTREHCARGANTNGSFDQCASVGRGEYWDYTFTKSGTFGYHNHVGASSVGTVIVR